jgi:ABC-type transport system involved in multi-copper enzyme maturation permease subunit
MGVVWAIATTTLGEAIRRRVLLIILLVAVGLLLIAPGLTILQPRGTRDVLVAMGLGVIQLCSAMIAIILVIYLIPNEVERRTIYTVLAKPVQRWQFLLGKFLGSLLSLFVMMLLMGISFMIVFWWQQHMVEPRLVKGIAMYFIQVMILASVAMMFSTFVSPLVNFFLSSGVYMVGNVLNPFFETISQNRGVGPATKAMAQLVHYIVPNFANYNIQNPIMNPEQVLQNDIAYLQQITLSGFIYAGIMIIIAIIIFDRREV